MLRHGVKDTDSELFLGMLVGALNLPISEQMKPPLILPIDSQQKPRSRASEDVAVVESNGMGLNARRRS